MAKRRLARTSWAALAALSLGACHAGVRPPPAASAPWVDELMGGPSHVAVIVRPRALDRDPYWGPVLRRALDQRRAALPASARSGTHSEEEVWQAEQLELFFAIADATRLLAAARDADVQHLLRFVMAIHGLPATDPAKLESSGAMVFAGATELPTGVREYPPHAEARRVSGPLSVWLYVMPSGTWLLTDGRTRERARAYHGENADGPLPMDVSDDTLLAVFADASLLDAREKGTEPWRRGIEDLGLALRGGSNGAVDVVLNYEDTNAAGAAKDWIEDSLQATCTDNAFECALVRVALQDVETARDGAAVRVSFVFSNALLELLLKE